MSLFTRQLATLKSALEAAGIDAAAIDPSNAPTYLADHIAAQVEASTEGIAEQLQTQAAALAAAQSELAAAQTLAAAYATGLSAAGVAKLPEQPDAAAISAAVAARASVLAGQILASEGHSPTLLPDNPAANPAAPGAPDHSHLKGLAKVRASISSLASSLRN